MKQNFTAQVVQLLKRWLCDVQSGIVMEKNWAHSVDQCWLQVLQFSVHLIDLLRILLIYNDFARIQKAVVDQTSSRPPNSDQDPFVGASLALGDVSELLLSPATELVIASCHITSSFHHISQSDQRRRQGSLMVKDREAWRAAVHGSQRVGHDLTNDHHHHHHHRLI